MSPTVKVHYAPEYVDRCEEVLTVFVQTDPARYTRPDAVQLAASVVLDALAHYRQHADAYEPIVAALRDLPASAVYDPGTNTCRLCDWIDGEHTDLCPWWLAQQTEGGEA